MSDLLEIKCDCKPDYCNDVAYAQTDHIKGKPVVMIGCDGGGEEAWVWLTPDHAREFAEGILKLAQQLQAVT